MNDGCGKCGLTYPEHQRDKPRHVYQGFVWLPSVPHVPTPTQGEQP